MQTTLLHIENGLNGNEIAVAEITRVAAVLGRCVECMLPIVVLGGGGVHIAVTKGDDLVANAFGLRQVTIEPQRCRAVRAPQPLGETHCSSEAGARLRNCGRLRKEAR